MFQRQIVSFILRCGTHRKALNCEPRPLKTLCSSLKSLPLYTSPFALKIKLKIMCFHIKQHLLLKKYAFFLWGLTFHLLDILITKIQLMQWEGTLYQRSHTIDIKIIWDFLWNKIQKADLNFLRKNTAFPGVTRLMCHKLLFLHSIISIPKNYVSM